MKRITFTFLLLLTVLSLQAQEWYPAGTAWYYDSKPKMINTLKNRGYIAYKVEKDTLYHGENAKEISVTLYKSPDEVERSWANTYLYERNKQVYLWNDFKTEYELLYDFNLNIGDTLYSQPCTEDTYAHLIVDSIGTVLVGDVELQLQHLSFHIDDETIWWGESLTFVERVGHEIGFNERMSACITDQFMGADGLRCYIDDEVHYRGEYWNSLPNSGLSCDTIVMNVEYLTDPTPAKSISTYPNPAKEYVNVSSTNTDLQQITLYDLLGNERLNIFPNSKQSKLMTNNCPEGLYLLKIRLSSGEERFERILLE